MGTTTLPKGNTERIEWGNNFKKHFAEVAESFGFTAAEITAATNDAAMMVFVIENALNNSAFSKASNSYKQDILGGVEEGIKSPELAVLNTVTPPATLVEAGVIARLQIVCARVKAHQNYTDTIGELLMIATPETDNTIPAGTKPKGEGTAMNFSGVRLEWTKSNFDGVIIESQRGDETDWTRLDRDFRSPFDDERPPLAAGKPETRRYRLMYFIDNEPVGDWSDIIVVVTKP